MQNVIESKMRKYLPEGLCWRKNVERNSRKRAYYNVIFLQKKCIFKMSASDENGRNLDIDKYALNVFDTF